MKKLTLLALCMISHVNFIQGSSPAQLACCCFGTCVGFSLGLGMGIAGNQHFHQEAQEDQRLKLAIMQKQQELNTNKTSQLAPKKKVQ